jgi:hypothetical protein
MLSERKRSWLCEHQRLSEEVEEARRSSQKDQRLSEEVEEARRSSQKETDHLRARRGEVDQGEQVYTHTLSHTHTHDDPD